MRKDVRETFRRFLALMVTLVLAFPAFSPLVAAEAPFESQYAVPAPEGELASNWIVDGPLVSAGGSVYPDAPDIALERITELGETASTAESGAEGVPIIGEAAAAESGVEGEVASGKTQADEIYDPVQDIDVFVYADTDESVNEDVVVDIGADSDSDEDVDVDVDVDANVDVVEYLNADKDADVVENEDTVVGIEELTLNEEPEPAEFELAPEQDVPAEPEDEGNAEEGNAEESMESLSLQEKMSPPLLVKMDEAGDDDKIPVWIWFGDIDQDKVDEQAERDTGLTVESLAVDFEPVPEDLVEALEYASELEFQAPGAGAAGTGATGGGASTAGTGAGTRTGAAGAGAGAAATGAAQREMIAQKLKAYIKATEPQRRLERQRTDIYVNARRKAARNAYIKKNSAMAKELDLPEDEVLFQSQLTPSMIVYLTKAEILDAAKSSDVVSVDFYDDSEKPPPLCELQRKAMRVDTIRDLSGLTGAGVNVLMNDHGWTRPDAALYDWISKTGNIQNVIDKAVYPITNTSVLPEVSQDFHPNLVAGTMQAFASDVNIYSVGYYRFADVEWVLMNRNIHLINGSINLGWSAQYENDSPAKWFDAIISAYNVTLTASAGNDKFWQESGWPLVITPSSGYNCISAGAYNTDGATLNTMWDFRYNPTTSTDLVCYKPDIVIAQNSTSEASPSLTGILAMMVQLKPSLAATPELVKAIVMASCHRKVSPANGTAQENMADGLTQRQGAGAVDAYRIISIVAQGNYGIGQITSGSTDIGIVQPAAGANINVSMAWLRKNAVMETTQYGGSANLGTLQELELRVYRGATLMGTSAKKNAGKQMVYFPSSSDTQYTIRVTKASQNLETVQYAYAWSATDITYKTEAPVKINSVTITGTPKTGSVLAANVTYSDSVISPDLTYRWEKWSSSGWSAIPGATSGTYTPTTADINSYIQVTVTGTGINVEGTMTSPYVYITASQVTIGSVTITGAPRVGSTLTVNISYSGSVTNPAVTYKWEKLSGAGWFAISGATSASYTPVAADNNSSIRVTITGTGFNVEGSMTSSSIYISPVAINYVTITGTPRVGSPLTASVTYSGAITNPTVTYRWEKWVNSIWVPISGATSSSYTPVEVDAGSFIQVIVMGNGLNVEGSRTSGYVLVETLPVTISSVSIIGAPRVGSTLTANVTYSGYVINPAVSYRWEKWDRSSWVAIPGATSSTYTPVAADVDSYIQVTVTGVGTNVEGSRSAAFVLITGDSVTINSVAITGTPRVGATLTANVTYSTTVTNPVVTYKWEKWNGSAWVAIPGATSASYTPVAADNNSYIQVTVTGAGVNVDGSKTSGSVLINSDPLTINSVTITGSTQVGSTLTANVTYSGSVTSNPGVTYQWEKWSQAGWYAISGATSASYTLVAADNNSYIQVTVTGTGANVNGSKTASYVYISPVTISSVAITGALRVGSTLTANITYSGSISNPAVTYRWDRWVNSAWVAIPGATSASYTLVAADNNAYIQVTVSGTGANIEGSKTSGFVRIEAAPATISSVTINGTPRVGSVLTAGVTYSGSVSNPAVTYKWEKMSNSTWVAISGATSASYTPATADADSYIRVTVTGAGANVSGSGTSPSVYIAAAPVSISSVVITGAPRVGSTLTAGVTYSSSVTSPAVTYQWERWSQAGWNAIPGATSASYALGAADLSSYIQVTVTGAGNVAGSKTAAYVYITT
ncbi:MAG: S8/S53 family peptidase [Oscillospiraceae bacterium]|nr:S8/S53 family peptidase [Oscillospiraceae bacterium]